MPRLRVLGICGVWKYAGLGGMRVWEYVKAVAVDPS